jgi:glycosyltransferase involved in cell wall biosynthesis
MSQTNLNEKHSESNSDKPLISVIVPVFNSSEYIGKCLQGLFASSYENFEVIAVDGGSTDDTREIAEKMKASVYQIDPTKGVAAARNLGAEKSQGEILLFVDSDVVVRKETLSLVFENFKNHPEIDALFGSYDDSPSDENFLSQYKNLLHHFHHQHAKAEASTFWTGCGAVRKSIFEEIGGFDDENFSIPSMEDIELGYRLKAKGYKILLDKKILVKHLKHWELFVMLKTDIFQRAIPWSCLILQYHSLPNDLNLKNSEKFSAVSLALLLIILTFSFFNSSLLPFSLIPLTIILILNYQLYSFLTRRKGLIFTLKVIPFHFLYFLYSGASFVFCWALYKTPAFKFIFRSSSKKLGTAKLP